MSRVDTDFDIACEKVRAFTKRPTDDEMLAFYGLYKQATVGDCNIPEPSDEDLTAKAKWNAWIRYKGIIKQVAKTGYILTHKKYAPQYA
ncbi:acyl-CoA-binding protein-like [Teleopsis dalmanni]|uniref:acyl-CoA-binding protein-like n=1 Tax=Teleopsis dalmanni TaxID=139649 RepID=UPI0018CF9677|nr:acyl-CoA-binding protein-like [Teleopsis dalmanni]XP_037940119.1 acyl-CoA-binding protein-like [Teleopsis dalmanni]